MRSSVQVLLRVRIAEMSRNVTRNLGINWQAMGSIGRFGAAAITATGAGARRDERRWPLGTPDVNAIIDALAQDNLARILAEPNLTAMSGQPASFLAGGEFPIPVGQQNNQVTIEFKQYGVSSPSCRPCSRAAASTCMSAPRSASSPPTARCELTAGNSSLQIPALTVRRAETTVELGSGQSFAIAGLLQDAVSQTSDAVPLLGDLPVIGAAVPLDELPAPGDRAGDRGDALYRAPGQRPVGAARAGRGLRSAYRSRAHPHAAPGRCRHARDHARIPGDAGFIVQ